MNNDTDIEVGLAELTNPTDALLSCAHKELSLSTPRVMGILNLTPDSFADGGKYHTKELVLQRVAQMQEEGADIIDIGAESSRPFAVALPLQQEIDRIMEVLEEIKQRFDLILSVDTYKPEVMAEAIRVGVHIINDIYALRQEGAIDIVARSNVAVCLVHMQGRPNTMQENPIYDDIIHEVDQFLRDRVHVCESAGIARNRLVLDPGFGFGKTTPHNMSLLKNLKQLQQAKLPLLAGLSRKFSIGEILNLPVEGRLYGSIAAHVIAVINGAAIIRTHDVGPTVQALQIAYAVTKQE